jgi:two-component system, OmpR family, sensor histidine kinase KdpD
MLNRPRNYLLAAGACVTMALVALPLRPYLDLVNIVMLFLLTVFLVSWRLEQGPAVLAAFLSVALFDFFFVPPHLTFAVTDIQYLLTFAVMLVVALLTGQMTAGLRKQARMARFEEKRTRALYEMARALSGALRLSEVVAILRDFLRDVVQADAVLLIPDAHGELRPQDGMRVRYELHLAVAVYEGNADDRRASKTMDGVCYYPLRGSTRIRGVLAVAPLNDEVLLQEDHPLLEAVASLIAIAVERLHYVDVAQQAEVQMASERLRSSVLSALSHDLRTPLTILVGLADTLNLSRPPLAGKQKDMAEAVRDQSMRISGLVENLLDMARLHAGQVKLRREWQPLEEVVGASLKLLERALEAHPVRVELAPDLPLLEFDAVLIERVLCNLLENAAKYSPAGSPVEIRAHRNGAMVEVSVGDYGSGIPQGRQDRIFDMFVRGAPESPMPGVGLGLAICRAIVEAHGGTISAANRAPSGACFTFTLPVGNPPEIIEESLPPEVAA